MGKNSFVLYFQWRELFNLLDDENAGKAIKAIFAFAESGEVPENLSPDAKMLFAMVRSQMEKDLAKYTEVCEKRRNAGALGGRNKANKTKREKEQERELKTSRFTPPTVEEVQDFISENSFNVDADSFVSFYASKDWRVGREKMKDWKAACRGWHSRNKAKGEHKEDGTSTDFDRSIYES